MLPINLGYDKSRMFERCIFFIRSKLKCKPHENTVCFSYVEILHMEIDRIVT